MDAVTIFYIERWYQSLRYHESLNFKTMNFILESNGNYFIGKEGEGRYIAKSEDLNWCNRWVFLLNENHYKEGYMIARRHYGL